MLKQSFKLGVVGALLAVLPQTLPAAGDHDHHHLEESLEAAEADNISEAKSQARIDALDDGTRRMLDKYLAARRELEALKVYNDQLDVLVQSQLEEKQSMQQQMVDIDLTQREVVPLMLRMIGRLEEFVQVDHPFLQDERQLRIKQLRSLMNRSDVSSGEKYRRVLEAYQIEMEYGRTIEAYQETLDLDGNSRMVNILRIGRLAIYFQTLDGKQTGHWNSVSGNWELLPDRYSLSVRQGLRIARKQAAPDLMRLPVTTPGGAQ